jgi:hypothetical protein
MKIVLNKDYGGFGYGVAKKYDDIINHCERTDAELIEFVETHPDECGDLKVVEISDEATDWEIDEYDGLESVTYVVDGKIYHA